MLGSTRPRLCSVGQSGPGIDLALALEDVENDRLAVGAAAASAPDPTRRSFPPQRRTAGAGPRRHARSLKARPVHGVAVQAAAWRAVGGEVADDLADSGLGNPRTFSVHVFHCHTKATGHSARHDSCKNFGGIANRTAFQPTFRRILPSGAPFLCPPASWPKSALRVAFVTKPPISTLKRLILNSDNR